MIASGARSSIEVKAPLLERYENNIPTEDEMDDSVQPQVQEDSQVPEENVQENETLTTNQPEEPAEQPQEQSEPVESEPSEPTVEDAPVEEEDDSYSPFELTAPQQGPTPQIDLSQVPTNEDGTLNADALAQQINNQLAAANEAARQAQTMVQELEEKRREEQLWHKAQERYPELKSDKQLAEEAQAFRMGLFMSEVSSGKQDAKLLSPAQAYERLNKRFSQAKAAGIKQATQSVQVQESAYIEPTNPAGRSEQADKDSLFRSMRSPNRTEAEKAANDYLDRILFGE